MLYPLYDGFSRFKAIDVGESPDEPDGRWVCQLCGIVELGGYSDQQRCYWNSQGSRKLNEPLDGDADVSIFELMNENVRDPKLPSYVLLGHSPFEPPRLDIYSQAGANLSELRSGHRFLDNFRAGRRPPMLTGPVLSDLGRIWFT